MQSLWLIIVVFFLILIVCPLNFKINFGYDLFLNLGAISLYLYFVKIFAYKIKYQNGNITLITKKDTKDIELQVSEKQIRFIKQLTIQLKQKIVVKEIAMYSSIGLYNAMSSALLSGLISSIGEMVLAFIKNTKNSAKISMVNYPDYNARKFETAIYASVSITLIDVIYSLIMSLIISKRREKYERIK